MKGYSENRSHLIMIPYVPHLAEYAWKVREMLLRYSDKNCIIAVDLPEGFESSVIAAVRDLPKPSVIIDVLNRSIPVIPTSAPIEAVRSYLDLGQDLIFLDTPFPICCHHLEWEQFQSSVRSYGLSFVIDHAEELGIDLNNIIGLNNRSFPEDLKLLFEDLPETNQCEGLRSDFPYLPNIAVRRQVMAMKIQHLLRQKIPVICICHYLHLNPILSLLQQKLPFSSHEKMIVPSRTVKVCESDIPRITNEIPYHMYLYELYRDTPVDRDKWLEMSFHSIEIPEDVETLKNILRYSKKIVLTRGRRNPDLSCILSASQCCTDEQYTRELRQVLLSYPPADKESDEPIQSIQDFNFQNTNYSTSDESIHQIPWKKMRLDRMNLMNRHRNQKKWYIIYRTPESIQNELKARKYFSQKYRSNAPGDDIYAKPFTAGVGEGIAVRETLRDVFRDQIYIQDCDLHNNASYVFNFGGKPKKPIYYYKRRALLGFFKKRKNHYMFTHVALFARSQKHIEWYWDELDITEPFRSTLQVALKYSDKVFMFSELFPDISLNTKERSKIVHIPLSRIPPKVQHWVKDFYSKD